MKIVAVIPVKAVSERVESKNFRDFIDGRSLFDILLSKLVESKVIDKIYVSSDAKNIKDFVERKGCSFIERDKKFCNNQVPWSDVIAHVAESIPEKDDTVLCWCHTTSPLFDEYEQAIKDYKKSLKDGFDGLVSVCQVNDFIVSEKGQPLNYSWGPWHKYSQFLDKYYSITGALFITTKGEMVKNRYVISKNPFFYKVSDFKSIDVDTEFDFKLAQLLYMNRSNLLND